MSVPPVPHVGGKGKVDETPPVSPEPVNETFTAEERREIADLMSSQVVEDVEVEHRPGDEQEGETITMRTKKGLTREEAIRKVLRKRRRYPSPKRRRSTPNIETQRKLDFDST